MESSTKSESGKNKEEERETGDMRELSSHSLPQHLAVFLPHISLRHPDNQNARNRNTGTLEQCVGVCVCVFLRIKLKLAIEKHAFIEVIICLIR